MRTGNANTDDDRAGSARTRGYQSRFANEGTDFWQLRPRLDDYSGSLDWQGAVWGRLTDERMDGEEARRELARELIRYLRDGRRDRDSGCRCSRYEVASPTIRLLVHLGRPQEKGLWLNRRIDRRVRGVCRSRNERDALKPSFLKRWRFHVEHLQQPFTKAKRVGATG